MAKPEREKRLKDLAFRDHDHSACVEEALATAEQVCGRSGVRFTDLRRRVLELIWRSHGPIGAYEALDRLRADGRRAAPPTVYRALRFLSDEGLIHRIESLNAYVGCIKPGKLHDAQHLICSTCGDVAEMDVADITRAIEERAENLDFSVRRKTVEVLGLCERCRERGEGELV